MSKPFLISLLGVLAIGYGALLAFLYLNQARMIYFPYRELAATPAAVGLPFEEQWLKTADGMRIHAWFLPHPAERGVILFSHGNGGNLSHRLDSLRIFHALGWSVLIYDYRGYGLSDGAPDEAGTYRDAEAAWRHLVDGRGYRPERIVSFGRSLGGAVAAELASRHPPAALILESTFTSVPDMAAELYPLFPVRLLARYRYDARARLAEIHTPLLVIHSRDDEIVPFRHGERLFAAAGDPKRFVAIEGGHNDGFLVSGERYLAPLAAFLGEVGGAPPGGSSAPAKTADR